MLPEEPATTAAIIDEMSRFLRLHYGRSTAGRAGNTKTHGMLRGEFTVAMTCPRRFNTVYSATRPAIRRGFGSPALARCPHRISGSSQ